MLHRTPWLFLFCLFVMGCSSEVSLHELDSSRSLTQSTSLLVRGEVITEGQTVFVELADEGETTLSLTVVSTQLSTELGASPYSFHVWGVHADLLSIARQDTVSVGASTSATFTLKVASTPGLTEAILGGITLAWGDSAYDRLSVMVHGTRSEKDVDEKEVVVAVGRMGTLLVSDDLGHTWYESTGQHLGEPSRYIQYDEHSAHTRTSPISRPDTIPVDWKSVVYTGSRFMVFADEPYTSRFRGWSSFDGFHWEVLDTLDTRVLSPESGVQLNSGLEILQASNAVYSVAPESDRFRSIAFDRAGALTALATDGVAAVLVSNAGAIYRSFNGQQWDRVDPENDVGLEDVTFGNNRFVTVGFGGQVLVSDDGENWWVTRSRDEVEDRSNSCDHSVDWCSVRFNGTHFIAYTMDDESRQWIRWSSPDGEVWDSDWVSGAYKVWDSFSEEDTILSIVEKRNIGMAGNGESFTPILQRSWEAPRIMDISVGWTPKRY